MSSAASQIAGLLSPTSPGAAAAKGVTKGVSGGDGADRAAFAALVTAAGAKSTSAGQGQKTQKITPDSALISQGGASDSALISQDGASEDQKAAALLAGTFLIPPAAAQNTPAIAAVKGGAKGVSGAEGGQTKPLLTTDGDGQAAFRPVAQTATNLRDGIFAQSLVSDQINAAVQPNSAPLVKSGSQKQQNPGALGQEAKNQTVIKGVAVPDLTKVSDQAGLFSRVEQPQSQGSTPLSAHILARAGQATANAGASTVGTTPTLSFAQAASPAPSALTAAKPRAFGASVNGKKTASATSSGAQAKGTTSASPANTQALLAAAQTQKAGLATLPLEAAALNSKQNFAGDAPIASSAPAQGGGGQADGLAFDPGASGSVTGSSVDQNGNLTSRAHVSPTPQNAAHANHAPRLDAAALAHLATRLAARAQNGNTRFEMRLDPAELGRVKVRIDVSPDNRVEAVLSTHRPEVLADLQKGADGLRRALVDQGFDLDPGDLSFSLDHSGAQGGQENQGGFAPSFSYARLPEHLDIDPVTTARIDLGYGLDRVADGRVDVHI